MNAKAEADDGAARGRADNDVGRPTSKIGRIRALFRKAYARLQEYALEGDSAMHNVLGTILGISNTVGIAPLYRSVDDRLNWRGT